MLTHRGLIHRLAPLGRATLRMASPRAVVLPAVLSLIVPGAITASVAATSPPASRYASIVLDAETGTVLYERNADLARHPASLTKIMTLYLAFEAIGAKKLSLGENLVLSAHAVSRDPSRLDLSAGSKLKVEDAIRAMTTKSANDAAAAIAERLAGGSESRFAQMMTAKAKKLGLAHTTFRNASGLPDEGQVSTARDLALLCQALIRDFPEQYRFFSMRSFDYRGTRYPNQNRFLRTYYGADGIKTGFVNASGHNLAASAVRGGKRLIAVVLGGDTQGWTREHTTRLLDVAYAKIDPSLVMVASAAPAEGGATAAGAAPPTSADSSPSAAAPAAAPPAPTVSMVTYATPAGAVTRPATTGLPLPNGTANLAAYAAAASAPPAPAGSVPASPPLPDEAPAPAKAPGTAVVASARPVDAPSADVGASPAKPSPIAPLDPAPVAEAPQAQVPALETTAATRSTEPASPRPPTVSTNATPPAPAAADRRKPDAPAPRAPDRVSAAPRAAASPQVAVSAPPAAAPAKAVAEAAAPAGERVTTGDDGGNWSVQLGLYRDATVARRRGEEARQRMPLALRNADLVVDRALDGVHVTSRIGRLSEQEARAACSELQRGSFPCVVVPPGRPLVVATN